MKNVCRLRGSSGDRRFCIKNKIRRLHDRKRRKKEYAKILSRDHASVTISFPSFTVPNTTATIVHDASPTSLLAYIEYITKHLQNRPYSEKRAVTINIVPNPAFMHFSCAKSLIQYRIFSSNLSKRTRK